MKKKQPRKLPAIAIVGIVFAAILIAYMVFVAVITYQGVRNEIEKNNRIVVSLTSLSCDETKLIPECELLFSLRNDNDEYIVPDLNGTNGPGYAESHVKNVTLLFDDGTKKGVYANDAIFLPSRIEPHETRNYKALFVVDPERRISSVTVLNTTFTFNR